ncbi:MAG: hypothetical protein COZ59_00455 [Bacteroidetes bacterium CG_4_8_14_3_um_filter_31_14]|nr:MAG: hypothetical protein COZ59_00455 [Bacteroidetes bacterium CG_4_8_14_3_um_filter_31_14]
MRNLLFLIFISTLFLFSCKQKDREEPLIILNGDNPMTVVLGSMWEDPGATVDDNFDGSSIQNSMTVTHNIDINGPDNGPGPTKLTGTYQVTYTVSDKSDNVATVVRTVKVVNSSELFATKYETDINADIQEQIVKDTTILSQDITFDTRKNYKVWFSRLGGKINKNPDSIVSTADTIANTIRVGAYFFNDSIKINDSTKILRDSIIILRQTYYIKEKEGINLVPYLYQVKGYDTLCKILDPIDPYFVIKYKIEKYKIVATDQCDKDTLGRHWKIYKSDNVTETWIRY